MDDDLKVLRSVRQRPLPSDAARSAARAALLERATAAPPAPARRFRLPRTGFRLAAVGALAVTIAAGVTVAQNLGGTDENGHRHTGVPGLPAGPVASAAELVHRATVRAAAQPAGNPRPDQWTYLKERYATSSAGMGGALEGPPDGYVTVERWIRVDGTRRATRVNGGRIELSPPTPAGRSITPRTDYAYLQSLPTDPKALLALIYRRSGSARSGRDAAAFSAIQRLMRGSVLPPKLRAGLYGALAAIPGVHFARDVTDAAGRHGVALYRIEEGYLRTDVIIDPTTYAYLGHRDIAVRDHTSTGTDGTARSRKGQILGWSAQLTAAIVDRSGAGPN
jgi:hypothetical protein